MTYFFDYISGMLLSVINPMLAVGCSARALASVISRAQSGRHPIAPAPAAGGRLQPWLCVLLDVCRFPYGSGATQPAGRLGAHAYPAEARNGGRPKEDCRRNRHAAESCKLETTSMKAARVLLCTPAVCRSARRRPACRFRLLSSELFGLCLRYAYQVVHTAHPQRPES
jgi:hypothetical protein